MSLCRESSSHAKPLFRTVSHSAAPSEVQGSSSQCVVLGTGAQARVRAGKAILSHKLTAFSSSLLPLHSPPRSLPFLPLHRLPSLPGPSRNDISPTLRLCLWKAEAYAWQVTHELCNMAALSSGRVGIPKQFLFCFAFGLLLFKQKIGKQAEMCFCPLTSDLPRMRAEESKHLCNVAVREVLRAC